MALKDIMEVTEAPSYNLLKVIAPEKADKKIGISKERIMAIEPILRQYVAF